MSGEPKPRIALLGNPDSGSGEAGAVASRLRGLGAEVTGYGLDEIDVALGDGPQRVAVAGGDGSIAGVAEAAGRAGVPLAVIPTGTANDFARDLGIPLDTDEACALAVRGDRLRPLDLATIGDRPFVNVASLGLPPAAARRAAGLKGALGPVAYFVGALGAGLRAQPVRCEVRCDDRGLFKGAAWQVTFACTGAFGAGSNVGGDPQSGRLDVVVIEARSRARLIAHAFGLRTGRIGAQRGVSKHSCRSATLVLDGEQPLNVDGEIVSYPTVELRARPLAVEVIVGCSQDEPALTSSPT